RQIPGVVFFARQHFAQVDPDLDANHTKGRVGLGRAVVDVGAQRVTRNLTFADCVDATHVTAAQATRYGNHDATTAGTHRLLCGLLHGPLPGNAAFKLLGDTLRHQPRVQLGLGDLAHVDLDLLLRQILQLLAQQVDAGTLATDDHARARRVDDHVHLVGLALDLDVADTGLVLAA